MRILQLLRIDHGAKEIGLHLLGDDGQTHVFTLPGPVACRLIEALADAANDLDQRPQMKHGMLHEVIHIAAIQADDGRRGVVFRTKDGSDVHLMLDASRRAVLRSCIDQIEREESEKRIH